jgi:hypothetical protein
VALPGIARPDPATALAAPGVACVAPGDGASAAAAAARTLHVAKQYIQHRKDREAPAHMEEEPLGIESDDRHLDRQPLQRMMSEAQGTVVLRHAFGVAGSLDGPGALGD